MDFMHISGQKEAIWNTLFSIFERWRAPKRRGPGKTFPPPSPSRWAWADQIEAQVDRLGSKVISHLALFCIHQMNRVNSRNGSCHDDNAINIVASITVIITTVRLQ